jgi:biopolymer transport protein ExbD
MAVSLKDPHDGDIAEISDINVTPFIDLILVLLIIFMVAAPLSTVVCRSNCLCPTRSRSRDLTSPSS